MDLSVIRILGPLVLAGPLTGPLTGPRIMAAEGLQGLMPWPVDCPSPATALDQRCVVRGALAGGAADNGWTVVPADTQHAAVDAGVLADAAPFAGLPGAPAQRTGGGVLHLAWRFAGGQRLEYIELTAPAAPLVFADATPVIGLRLRGNDRLVPRVRFSDAQGETFQYDAVGGGGAQWTTALVDLGDQAGHWGGDGVVQWPLTMRSVVFDRPVAGFAGNGALSFGGIAEVARLAQPELAIRAAGPRPGRLFAPGESLRLHAASTTPGATVAWELRDGFGRELSRGGGADKEVLIDLPMPRRIGAYACRFTASAPGMAPLSRDYLCAVPDEPATGPGFAGVCTHWSGWPLEGIALLRRHGITAVRDEVAWSAVEKAAVESAPGTYAHPRYDGGGYPNSPAAIAGFAAYAGWMARTVGPQVSAFEVWNEWVGGCGMSGKGGDHSPAAYGPLAAATHAALKAVDPRLPVVVIGGEYGPQMAANVAAMVDHGATGDGFSVHPYCYPTAPELGDVAGMIDRVRAALRERGQPDRVWASEVGWPTHHGPRGVSLVEQGRLTARALALLWAAGCERTYCYDFMDDGLDAAYNEHNFGLVLNARREWAPKPAALAVAAFNRRTAVVVGERRLVRPAAGADGTPAAGPWLACGRLGDGRDVVVAWATAEGLSWTAGGTVERVWDQFGAPLDEAPDKLGPAVVYLVGRGIAP